MGCARSDASTQAILREVGLLRVHEAGLRAIAVSMVHAAAVRVCPLP